MPTTMRWLGHGSWSLETGGHKVLLDPFLDDSPSAPCKAADVEAEFVLVSHGHFDHVADAASIATRCDATVVSNFEVCEWLQKKGVKSAQPMNLGGGIDLPFGRVQLTLAHHSSVMPDGAYGGNPGGFLLTLDDGKIYFACDTALFYDMKLIGAAGIDLAVLPIGDRFTMGPADAVEAVKLIGPKRVLPAHYNTWPPIEQDAQAWAARVKAETKAEPLVIEPGATVTL
ncbi:MAG: metal-dependent hydrolase [Planctomycetota bacterium]|nr:MAG: metal-dependent hydrolase [Planctomycetota bacterium]